MTHKGATAAVSLALAAALGAGASPASAEPEMVLPDATLFCGSSVIQPHDWVMHNGATMWITGDDLTGHYVILSFAHYFVEGLLTEPPASYDGLPAAGPYYSFGQKAALQGTAMSCDFVSRWDTPEGEFSIVGPITISKVSG